MEFGHIHRKMSDQLAKSWPYVTVNRKEKRETAIAVAKLCPTSIKAAAASCLFVVEILNLNGKYYIVPHHSFCGYERT